MNTARLIETDFDTISIKNEPLFDLNNRDSNIVSVTVSNIPQINNHIGSLVFFAAMITAIGRT